MTPRERVMTSVNHQEPDRLAVDLGAMRSTGIQAIAYNRLKAHLGLPSGWTRVYDLVQQLAEPEPGVLDLLGIDATDAGWDFPTTWRPWSLPDGSPGEVPDWFQPRREGEAWRVYVGDQLVAEMPPGCFYLTQLCWPMVEGLDIPPGGLESIMPLVMWAGIPTPMFAGGLSEENLGRIADHCRHLYEDTDRALMLGFGGNLFEWLTFLRRIDNALMDLVLDPEDVEAVLDKLVEIHLGNLDKVFAAVGETVQLIQMGDDLGTEQGPFFSPEIYRRLFKPRHKILFDYIHKHSKMKVFLHSCGSLYKILPDLIEAGVDVINPAQISAADMGAAKLKKEFGKDLTFWGGGCDTQTVLPRGTPQEVHDHVKETVDIWAPGGGYVFCQVHNILADVPPANVEAMYKAIGRL
ncbi:MAG: methyltransferase [Phycisphaerae bacterium]|nr:methyltransferase [Phycisphaerae bacterium]